MNEVIDTYIFYTSYESEGKEIIFYVGKGLFPFIDYETQRSIEYQHLLDLKGGDKNFFDTKIIESVSKNEADYWQNYYCDLFHSWGYELVGCCRRGNPNTPLYNPILSISKKLFKKGSCINTLHKVKNDRLIFLLIYDLLENQGIGRELDELLLFLLLKMVQGSSLSELLGIKFFDLKKLYHTSILCHEKQYFPKLVYYFHTYITKYGNISNTKADLENVFLYLPKTYHDINHAIRKLSAYFGFNNNTFDAENPSLHKHYVRWVNFKQLDIYETLVERRKKLIQQYQSPSLVHDLSYNIINVISDMANG